VKMSKVFGVTVLVASFACVATPLEGQVGGGSGSEVQLREYVGQYRAADEPDDVLAINLDGGKLYAEGERTPRVELKLEKANNLAGSGVVERLEAIRNGAGKVSGNVC
jgi:hypothetical protein